MKTKFLLLAPIAALALSACSIGGKHYDTDKYIRTLDFTDGFRILQLTDIHLSDKDNQDRHFKFMDLTIKESNANFIVVTGDLFTFASKSTAIRLFDFLDSYGIPWSVVYGNHDEQCYFPVEWLTGYLNDLDQSETSNCVFVDLQDDDVHGNCNFAINLMKDDKVFEQLILMDSNRYHYGFDYNGYDYFREDQVEWYKRLTNDTKANNGGTEYVESLMFYHIPLPQVNNAWDEAHNEDGTTNEKYIFGEKREKSCPPEADPYKFFDVIKESGTKGMFFGHDHINNFCVTYEGVQFCYGIKSTDAIYYDEDMMGGRVIQINNDHSLTYDHYYHTYAEVE